MFYSSPNAIPTIQPATTNIAPTKTIRAETEATVSPRVLEYGIWKLKTPLDNLRAEIKLAR
jgi:hypothetical protein